jgi:hypothetical protein
VSESNYPSVSIVAGPISLPSNPIGTLGHMLKMHGGAMYITIDVETAKQWISVLETIAEESK